MILQTAPRGAARRLRRALGAVGRETATELDRLRSRRGRADLAVFHELSPPPGGGGHQFLRALVAELEQRGLVVEWNRVSRETPACLFNSFNFDFRRLRRFARDDCRMVHRLDGPIGVYRGSDDGTDARIAALNAELARATIVQSRFSLEAHRKLGIELRAPAVVHNAVDPAIFFPPPEREPLAAGRRVRVIAASWSDNSNKGADVLSWLDRHLDPERFEFSFAGRTQERYERIEMLGAIPSWPLADALRRHDVYLAPSRNDPCSNALLEALACGLPAVYRDSGGHPELVGDAGIGFSEPEEAAEALARIVPELDDRRAAISLTPLAEVAGRYLEVLAP